MSSIFVIDDSPGARLFATAALGKGAHTVTELEPTCLYSVLEALHKAPPDLLVTDLIMPGCPGMTLIRACREDAHLQQIRILLLTSHGSVQLAHFLQAMGNTHYLAKPVSPSALVECAELLLSPNQEPDPGWSLACGGVVAVVDDSRLSRAYHAACLRKAGYRPVQVEPTALLDTVLAIEKAKPQLLVVDFLMPEFRGDALIRAIRARESLRDIPALMVTAHHSDELSTALQAIGQVETLFKPITAEELIAKVRERLPIDAGR
jgi:CheY-like chemotaxis protein